MLHQRKVLRSFFVRRGVRFACRLFGQVPGGRLCQPGDQIAIVALRFGLGSLDAAEYFLDAVERLENQGHCFGRDLQHAVAEFTQHVLAGVSDALEPRQSDESAGAFDRMDQTENLRQYVRVVRVALELDEFGVDDREALGRLGQKFGH